MKNAVVVFLGCLTAALLLLSCNPERTYPSPLQGISVDDVTVEANETSYVIDVPSPLVDISGRAIDLSTNLAARWLLVDVSERKVTLTLQENITVKDRQAEVILYFNGKRTDVDDCDLTVHFYVTQKKNRQFEGISIEELVMSHERGDTALYLPYVLNNVKTQVRDLNGEDVKWCTARLYYDELLVTVDEHRSSGSRQAVVRLIPSGNVLEADSLIAHVAFLITQHHNPVLDSLNLSPVVLDYEGTRQVIKTDRQLTGIRAQVIDDETHAQASWCNVAVAGDSIVVNASLLSTLSERSAKVTLFLPNKGAEIDSTTIATTFDVKQQHNTVFDGVNIPEAILRYNQTRLAFKVRLPSQSIMKNIKARVTSLDGSAEETWLRVSAAGDSIVLTAPVYRDLNDRQARVTLYYPSGTFVDTTTVQTSFPVKQTHNTVFDGVRVSPAQLRHDETRHVLKIRTQMADIRTLVTDSVTGKEVKWLTAAAAGDSVVLRSEVLRTSTDRQAVVTLYYPNGKAVTDSTVVKTQFSVKQQHNTVFDDAEALTWTIPWDATSSTFTMKHKLTDIRCRLTDRQTHTAPTWISATVDGWSVNFKCKVNEALEDRSAEVMLYYPNGNDFEQSEVRHSFTVTQSRKLQIVLDKHEIDAGYQLQKLTLKVNSNVTPEADPRYNKGWARLSNVKEVASGQYDVTLELSENGTESVRSATLFLMGKENNTVRDSVVVTQKTNPDIQLGGVESDVMKFRKGGGEFMLIVYTLTPDYQIVKKEPWISIASKVREGVGRYYHRINVQRFAGEGPLRHDTIFIKNKEVVKKLVIQQDKYVYLDKPELELEVGQCEKLSCTNYTSNQLTWSSSYDRVATVDQNGYVTAVARGTANIFVSIGEYDGIKDYKDFCSVRVITPVDKIMVVRGNGDYVKNDGYVTAYSPVVITNGYHKTICLTSVSIVGDEGKTVIPASGLMSGRSIEPDEQLTLKFAELKNVYLPKVLVKFKANGIEYAKEVDY